MSTKISAFPAANLPLSANIVVPGVDGGVNVKFLLGQSRRRKAVFCDATYGNDSTGAVDDLTKPFATINAALDAAGNANVGVFLSRETFGAVTHDYQGSTTPNPSSKLGNNISFIGSGKPRIASDKKSLVQYSGTVIQGGFVINTSRANFEVRGCGFDAGEDWCVASNGGTAKDAFVVANIAQGTPLLMKGLEVHDIIGLCKNASAAFHAVLIEDCYRPSGSNISAYFGTHGFVSKNVGGRFSGVESFGHSTECVYVKRDSYAGCDSTVISNIVGGSWNAADTPVGIYFTTTTSSAIDGIAINNAVFRDVTYDLKMDTQSSGIHQNIRIDNLLGDLKTPKISYASVDASSVWVNGHALNEALANPNPATFANVKLSQHAEGTNGSTTFTDSSTSARTSTVSGNAQLSTARSVVGGASSMLFDGTGDYFTVPQSTDFDPGTGDFCIRFWFYPTTLTAGNAVLGKWVSGANAWLLAYGNAAPAISGTKLRFVATPAGTYNSSTYDRYANAISLTVNAWNYVVVQRLSGVISFGIGLVGGTIAWDTAPTLTGGTAVAAASLAIYAPSAVLAVGGNFSGGGAGATDGVTGNLKEVQFIREGFYDTTKAYSVPTAPHPDV